MNPTPYKTSFPKLEQNSTLSPKTLRNYNRCELCGKRLYKGRNHRCLADKKLKIRFIIGQGTARGGVHSLRDFVKDKYVGKVFSFHPLDRTAIVRLFMRAFRKCNKHDYIKARRIRHFLKRFYLTNAEIHAVLFYIGFRYSVTGNSRHAANSPAMRDITIDGYYHHRSQR